MRLHPRLVVPAQQPPHLATTCDLSGAGRGVPVADLERLALPAALLLRQHVPRSLHQSTVSMIEGSIAGRLAGFSRTRRFSRASCCKTLGSHALFGPSSLTNGRRSR